MANEKFYFLFSEEPSKKVYIDEPDGWASVDHNLNQKENGHGRDESLSGGEFQFGFNDKNNHQLPTILYYLHRYKSKANVLMVTVMEDGTESVQQIHFPSSVTDDLTYFKCKMIVKSSLQVVKRRTETMVDVFSDVGINNEPIEPIKPVNMLLQAKPSQVTSKWTQSYISTASSLLLAPNYFNITQSLIQYDINDSLVPFKFRSQEKVDMQILEATSNLKNVTLLIKNTNISFTGGTGDKKLTISFINTSTPVANNTPEQIFFTKSVSSSGSGTSIYVNDEFNISVGDIPRGNKLYLFVHTTTNGAGIVRVEKSDVSVIAYETAYNSITPALRLIDVVKQIVKSISGLNVYAPRYDQGGQFYDTFITNGKLLAGITDKPFTISLDMIEKSIKPEHNADTEIDLEERVFIGIEEDFYTDEECWVFNEVQFDDFQKKIDPTFCIKEFRFGYEKFQSQKEEIQDNSGSTIHGESNWTPLNEEVDNSKECKVKWVRDAVLIDVQQRLSTKISKDTATQEDDTIFAIDTINTVNDQNFTETTSLQHTFQNTFLYVRNNGEVNFLVLGIREGASFSIAYPDPNAGEYSVFVANNNELQLIKTSGGAISNANDGIRLTKYTYQIKKETIPVTNRTNEGFTYINNLLSPDKYSNLRYSVKRNIINFWENFLATCNDAAEILKIKCTLYRNNGECETEYNGLRVKENEDFAPKKQILTPFVYEGVVLANVDYLDFVNIQRNIRAKRGYITCNDNNGRKIKLYHKSMSYVSETRELIFSGREKFEKSYLTITNETNNILINNETRLVSLTYEIVEKYKVALFDKERQRLYDPVYWDKITINGKNAETITELENWLKILE